MLRCEPFACLFWSYLITTSGLFGHPLFSNNHHQVLNLTISVSVLVLEIDYKSSRAQLSAIFLAFSVTTTLTDLYKDVLASDQYFTANKIITI